MLTPLLAALVLRRRVTRAGWTGTALAAGGLGLLTLRGLGMGPGELLTLGCAVCIALQIVGTSAWGADQDPYALAFAQTLAVAVAASLAAVPGGLRFVPPDASAWFAVLWTGGLATAAALVVQTWAQSRLGATRVAVIMTLEPVFAAALSALAGHELTTRQLLGAGLVLLAMFVVEIGSLPGSVAAAPVP
ncbi:DMT family transporter [Streptomyces sp. NRRL S-340]|uniref:DMT family transporter n=1 Tax=Streptomyces sp. NRRL S-340 TaxID=1463901 RepID=UPI00068B49A8|nr:DMT family transporter [Streptomyces sp. NRRL S-340]